MNNGIFSGWVRHRRFQPHRHEFTYTTQMVMMDVTESQALLDRSVWWSDSGLAPVQFRDGDYLPPEPGEEGLNLPERARSRAMAKGADDVSGRVLLLAQLRHWGYSFNPVVFHLLHDAGGRLSAIAAEITNTPWGERHTYWLTVDRTLVDPGRQTQGFRFSKEFHVSPFLPMGLNYDWRFTLNEHQVVIHMRVYREDSLAFDATLKLDGVPCEASGMRRLAWQFPGSATTALRIYWQALKLWLKRTPFFSHPARGVANDESGSDSKSSDSEIRPNK